MKVLRKRLAATATLGSAGAALATLFLAAPLLLAFGLWMLGVPLDWSRWQTYVGLLALWIAAAIA